MFKRKKKKITRTPSNSFILKKEKQSKLQNSQDNIKK